MFYLTLFLFITLSGSLLIKPPVKKNVLFFPLQITNNEAFPIPLYDCFLSHLLSNDVSVHKSSGDVEKDCNIINNILGTNETITLVSHSTGVNNLLKVSNTFNNIIDNVVLIDPILLKNKKDKFVFDEDMEDYVNNLLESNKFDMVKDMIFKKNKQKKIDLSNADNLLYLYSKKSNNWKLIPPVPPIKRLFLNYDLIHNKNKKYREINGFGHFDLLDQQFSDMVHKSVAKGCSNREDVCKYHEVVTEKIIEQ